jgi:hypothetical protein
MATAHTPVSGAPVQVYVPSTFGTPHVTLINEGITTVFIGQAGVTIAGGLPLAPTQSVTLPFAPFPLYAVTAGVPTATTVNTNAAANAGATTLNFAGAYATAAVNGRQVQIGVTGSTYAEVVTITTGGGTAALTVSPLQYDHRTATPVTVLSPAGVTMRVESGC